MKPVIEVNGISKNYVISHKDRASYSTIKDDFSKIIKRPFSGGAHDKNETFWALKDVSFEVYPGEVFGVVGKNGSGKSTLLKILSRVVEPTSGTIKMHGKTASLLEVGTGFHPELTGRENIYFNGSMIGMSREEITRKFDDIVAFSEVEKFLDTPVKFYSSGMYVRLAFAIAAHLDSEILILDEVLAVGDAAFQKKSMDKMLDIVKDGRTILFVSHSMTSVEQLCDRAMLLKKGKIVMIGDTEEITEKYLGQNSPKALEKAARAKMLEEYSKSGEKLSNVDLGKRTDRAGSGQLKVTQTIVRNSKGEDGKLTCGEDGEITIKYKLLDKSIKKIDVGISFDVLPSSQRIAQVSTKTLATSISTDTGEAKIKFKHLALYPGIYKFTIFIDSNGEILDWIKAAGTFEVERGKFYTSGLLPDLDQGTTLLDYEIEN